MKKRKRETFTKIDEKREEIDDDFYISTKVYEQKDTRSFVIQEPKKKKR